jgi:ribosome biogenesis GTPase / thiamine phosphate phosphatase
LKRGLIIKVNAGLFDVMSEGKVYSCRARGKFRIKEETPYAGDYVNFDENDLYLLELLPRKNRFIRPAVANVDQALIVASVTNPEISLKLLNRFIVMCLAVEIKPIVILSKVDLIDAQDNIYSKIDAAFHELDFKLIKYSSKTKFGLNEILQLFDNKVSILTGQTGVGKSTLINLILPDVKRETGTISKALGRGKHITRIVEFFPYKDGFIVDTPGFSMIDIDFQPIELASRYPGFKNLFHECKFNDCLHENETGCAVKKAVTAGKITASHYQVYLELITELKLKQKERYL